MNEIKKGVFRVKNEAGEYIPYHLQTSADQVLFEDNENLEQKMSNLEQPSLATPDNNGLMASTDKTKLDQLNLSDISDLKEDVAGIDSKVEVLEQAPRIVYGLEEPANAENGTIWIVGE